ncbi:hypothetical protein B7463_g4096, partial [Scytalidium lignicola]
MICTNRDGGALQIRGAKSRTFSQCFDVEGLVCTALRAKRATWWPNPTNSEGLALAWLNLEVAGGAFEDGEGLNLTEPGKQALFRLRCVPDDKVNNGGVASGLFRIDNCLLPVEGKQMMRCSNQQQQQQASKRDLGSRRAERSKANWYGPNLQNTRGQVRFVQAADAVGDDGHVARSKHHGGLSVAARDMQIKSEEVLLAGDESNASVVQEERERRPSPALNNVAVEAARPMEDGRGKAQGEERDGSRSWDQNL